MIDQPLWRPTSEQIAGSNMTAFARDAALRWGRVFDDYTALHQWSVSEPGEFWASVWKMAGVIASGKIDPVVENPKRLPGARWFPNVRLNFARNLLRRRDDAPALIFRSEAKIKRTLSYAELYRQVAGLAGTLRQAGIGPGDRVCGFMPNMPETVSAMLATASVGATWSSCSPDFGVQGVLDRFGQITPRVLFSADGYFYNGKAHDSLEKLRKIQQGLPSLEHTVVVPFFSNDPDLSQIAGAVSVDEFSSSEEEIDFVDLPFDHPLYIMYSSGTTGVPKCIVHGAGGSLLQHLKEQQLHVGLRPDDRLFYFTTCGWMMWNWLVSGMSTGCTLVLYDGSPFANEGNVLLDAIDDEGITVFGTSARYIAGLEKQGLKPAKTHQLSSVKTILSTGSPLSETSYEYIYRDFKADVCLSSISGGTDIISCFMLGNPNLPVYAGEIQCRGLGMAVEFWNQRNESVTDATGELVCTRSFPSTPIGFWQDPEDERFLKAYFAEHPGIWTHGDYGELTESGGIVIQGRSDAVLNPAGVRIGTAEIYRQVETISEVVDSIAVGQDWQGDERVVLFIVLKAGIKLNDRLIETIKLTIRQNTTPRHVPAKIIQVADIPRTISGKIVELAVRKVIHNRPVENTDALANPETLDLFTNLPELQS